MKLAGYSMIAVLVCAALVVTSALNSPVRAAVNTGKPIAAIFTIAESPAMTLEAPTLNFFDYPGARLAGLYQPKPIESFEITGSLPGFETSRTRPARFINAYRIRPLSPFGYSYYDLPPNLGIRPICTEPQNFQFKTCSQCRARQMSPFVMPAGNNESSYLARNLRELN